MWPTSYWCNYWTGSYWEKVGALGAVAPVGSGTQQYLPIMGIGCWLLLMVLP